MSIAKSIEISVESTGSFDDALQEGITQASKTVKNIKGAWVKNHEVMVEKNKVKKHRVHMVITFVIEGQGRA